MVVLEPIIAGLDEVGRGALCGPVVAGAAVLSVPVRRQSRSFPCWAPVGHPSVLIADSKLLSPAQREMSHAWLSANVAFGVGIVDASVIDEIGILRATEKAMRLALEQLRERCTPTELLIDGRDKFTFPLPHRSIIKGDQTEPAIAAASILAKVTRDRMMIEYDERYPGYGLAEHKGYGAESHRARIIQVGPCAIHRQSFLTKIIPEPTLFD